MKIRIKHITILSAIALLVTTVSCERDQPDNPNLATFPNTADIFTDSPVGLTDEFFVSFDPNGGANTQGFGTDENEAFEGTTSIRIDVPAPNDPDGNFIGGIFRDRGNGRNLTQYDALTFWARGSVNGSVLVGFGTDFEQSRFAASTTVQMTTGWKKYVIPIPDASKLVQEKGMFLFSAGGFDVFGDGPNGNEIAWTFWIDELRFETLGTNLLVAPQILNGQDEDVQTFTGLSRQIDGIGALFNLADGQNIFVDAATSYFNFSSSDSNVATVSDSGLVTVVGDSGTSTITASLAGDEAEGSLTITSNGAFDSAPDPTLPASNVISIYSDTYSNFDGLNFAIFNNDAIQIQTQAFSGNENVTYSNLGFVGIGWNGTVDASGMTHIHLDVQRTSPGSTLTVELLDFGPSGTIGGADDTAGGFNATGQLSTDNWVGLDIPLTAFTQPTGGGGAGNPNINNIGSVILVSNSGTFIVDNIYFYNNN